MAKRKWVFFTFILLSLVAFVIFHNHIIHTKEINATEMDILGLPMVAKLG